MLPLQPAWLTLAGRKPVLEAEPEGPPVAGERSGPAGSGWSKAEAR